MNDAIPTWKKTLVEVILADGKIIPQDKEIVLPENISLVQKGSPAVVQVNGQGRDAALRLYERFSDSIYFMTGEKKTDSQREYHPTLFFTTTYEDQNTGVSYGPAELRELLQEGPIELTYKGKIVTKKKSREIIPVQISLPILFDFSDLGRKAGKETYEEEVRQLISREAGLREANAYMLDSLPRRENGRDYTVAVFYRLRGI